MTCQLGKSWPSAWPAVVVFFCIHAHDYQLESARRQDQVMDHYLLACEVRRCRSVFFFLPPSLAVFKDVLVNHSHAPCAVSHARRALKIHFCANERPCFVYAWANANPPTAERTRDGSCSVEALFPKCGRKRVAHLSLALINAHYT